MSTLRGRSSKPNTGSIRIRRRGCGAKASRGQPVAAGRCPTTQPRKPNDTWRGANASAHATVALPCARYCGARRAPVLAGGATLPTYAAVACRSGDAPPRQLHRTDRRRSATGCPALRPWPRCGTLLLGSAFMQSATLRPRWLWVAPVHQRHPHNCVFGGVPSAGWFTR